MFVAERKSVSGIDYEFAITTDPSCLKCWITEVEWDEKGLNERGLAWLRHDSSTRYSAPEAIAIDDRLIEHEGKLIEEVGWFIEREAWEMVKLIGAEDHKRVQIR